MTNFKISEELFVIPDEDRYILYEPRKPNILLVNRGTVQILRNIQNGDRNIAQIHQNVVQQLLAHNIIVNGNHSQFLTFPPATAEFDPDGVSLFITTACSMRCIYCYSHGGTSPKTMPWQTAKDAVDWMLAHAQARCKKRFFVSLHGGGEVTTAGDLMKRCVAYVRRQAADNRLEVRIEAGLNGVMDLHLTDWVVEHLDGATISLDGPAAVQNAQRPLNNGKESFPIVSETLRRLDQKGFKYAIRMTVTQERIGQMATSIAYIAENYRATNIQVEPVFLVGRALDENLAPVDADLFIEEFRKAENLAGRFGISLNYSGARLHTTTNVFCKAATGNTFAVTTDGLLSSCYEVADPDDPRAALFFYGKYDPNTRRFIFDSQKIARLRTLTVENKPFCSKCFCKWHCAGDCPAKLAAMGDAWTPDQNFRCHINRELTKDQIRKQLVY